MLLVVSSHIELFMVGAPDFSLNVLLSEFRMPLFFFVSGFVFYKSGRSYGWKEMKELVRKKIFVQVVSPLLFLLVFCRIRDIDITHSLFTAAKSGYWFTFVLFEFFIIYSTLHRAMELVPLKGRTKDALWMVIGLVLYVVCAVGHQRVNQEISGLFAVEKIPYILYFILGTRVRKNWTAVEALLDSKFGVAVLVALFAGLNVWGGVVRQLPLGGVAFVVMTAVSGVFLTIAFFRHYADSFSSATRLGCVMQYVGRRTLDVYLIHYFLLESWMACGVVDFTGTSLYFLQFVVCIGISIVVMGGCMLVSNVLRTSPFLGHYLFGVKRVKYT